MNKNWITSLWLLCFSICIGCIIGVFLFVQTKIVSIDTQPNQLLSNDWNYYWGTNSDSLNTTSIPAKLSPPNEEKKLTISKILPDTFFPNATLSFRTAHKILKVYLDDTLIYSYGLDHKNNFIHTPGRVWHFIPLPQNYQDKEIKIWTQSVYNTYNGDIKPIYLGPKIAHLLMLIKDYGMGFFICILTLIIGCIILLVSYVHYILKQNETGLCYLGIFAIISALWTLGENPLLQFFIPNQVAIYCINVFPFFINMVPLLLFIKKAYVLSNTKIYDILNLLICINFLIALILKATLEIGIIELNPTIHVLAAITFILLTYNMLQEIKNGNKRIKIILYGFIVLCIGGIIDCIRYYASGYEQTSTCILSGVFVFIGMLVVDSLRFLQELRGKQIKADTLQKLAYSDLMTQLKNRTAFEEMMDSLNKNLHTGSFIILLFDVNNLKVTNDTQGHKAGDELIITTAHILTEAFNDIGDIFRIGGDEFAVITKNQSCASVEMHISTFNKLLIQHNEIHTLNVSVSYGYAVYDPPIDKDPYAVFIRADEIMYACKRRQKQQMKNAF